MRTLALVIAASIICGCGPAASDPTVTVVDTDNTKTSVTSNSDGPIKEFAVSPNPPYPEVGFVGYALLSTDSDRDMWEAEAVVQVMIVLAKATNSQKREDFEPVLSRDFTFHASQEFLNREAYIKSRLEDASDEKLSDYSNVAVQLLGDDRALVTFRNRVDDDASVPAPWKVALAWAGIMVKEEGMWKYESLRRVGFYVPFTPQDCEGARKKRSTRCGR